MSLCPNNKGDMGDTKVHSPYGGNFSSLKSDNLGVREVLTTHHFHKICPPLMRASPMAHFGEVDVSLSPIF